MKSPRLRRVISLVLASVCLGSGAMFVRRLLDYRTGDAAYAEAAQIAALPEPEPETTAEPAPEPSAEATPSAPQTPPLPRRQRGLAVPRQRRRCWHPDGAWKR